MPEQNEWGGLWPLHLKPLPDELLSSWVVRLAAVHALKLHTFCVAVWPARSFWNRDIDKSADAGIFDVLAARTATPRPLAAATGLAAYEGVLYETHNPYGNTRWIMPIGVYHRTRRAHGLQYCPACLEEDPAPYFRRAWRLACVTTCVRHERPLMDRCPTCSSPVQFFRGEMGARSKTLPAPVTVCHACQGDLRAVPADRDASLSTDDLLRQHVLARATREGWAWVPQHGPVHSHLYFTVVRQLLRLLATDRHGVRLREAAVRRYGVAPFDLDYPASRNDFEQMRVADRHRLLTLTLLLLSEWPHAFVELCEQERIWSSTLLREMEAPPFWYSRVVQEHLYRASSTRSAADRAWGKAQGTGVFGARYHAPKRERKPAQRPDWSTIFRLVAALPARSTLRVQHGSLVSAAQDGRLVGVVPSYAGFCRKVKQAQQRDTAFGVTAPVPHAEPS